MDKPWMPEKSNVIFRDDKNVPIILSYEWSPIGRPSAFFVYFGNKEYHENLLMFGSEKYGRDKVEEYWKKILNLDKSRSLTLDTLCEATEATFIPEDALRAIKDERKMKAN